MLNALILAGTLAIPAPAHRNLIVNGDFSAGNKGFKSGYTMATDLGSEGSLVVGRNPHDFHAGGASFGDHTSGKGLMLLLNGSPTPDTAVWEETLKVQPNRAYSFGFWAASWGQFGEPNTDPSPAKLVVTVNGKQLGGVFGVYPRDGAWTKFVGVWKSGTASSATIRIVDQNLEGVGNDFAIDDIVFHD